MSTTTSTTTTPAAAPASDTQITATVTAGVSWAQHHLFLMAVVAILTIGGVYGVESLIEKHDAKNLAQQQAILQTFTQQNAQVQAQTKAQIDTMVQQNAALGQQIATLESSIVARDAELIKNQQTVKTEPPTQLAQQWGTLATEPTPQINAQGLFLVPLPLAQKSVDAFLQLPVLAADKKDLQTQLTEETQVAANNQSKYEAEVKSHQGDNEENAQKIKVCNADIKDLKAKQRKRDIIIAILATAFGVAVRK